MSPGSLVASVLLVTLAPQVPPGYYEVTPPGLPDSLHEVHRGGKVTITISRTAETEDDRELIRRAEGLFPPASLVEGPEPPVPGSAAGQVALRLMGLHGPDRWWADQQRALLIPVAITGASVSYYLGQARLAADGAPGYRVFLSYRATVQPAPDPDGGRRVELRLAFELPCGGGGCYVLLEHNPTRGLLTHPRGHRGRG